MFVLLSIRLLEVCGAFSRTVATKKGSRLCKHPFSFVRTCRLLGGGGAHGRRHPSEICVTVCRRLVFFRAIAAFHNHAAMVELLLKHGGDPTLKNAYGKDALAMAQSSRADSSVAVCHTSFYFWFFVRLFSSCIVSTALGHVLVLLLVVVSFFLPASATVCIIPIVNACMCQIRWFDSKLQAQDKAHNSALETDSEKVRTCALRAANTAFSLGSQKCFRCISLLLLRVRECTIDALGLCVHS